MSNLRLQNLRRGSSLTIIHEILMQDILQTILGIDWFALIGQAVIAITALIAIFTQIPGEQPEKFLSWLLSLLTKISRK